MDQDHTIVNTDTDGEETEDTNIIRVADPKGVASPTEEDSNYEDEDDADMDERCQKEN